MARYISRLAAAFGLDGDDAKVIGAIVIIFFMAAALVIALAVALGLAVSAFEAVRGL